MKDNPTIVIITYNRPKSLKRILKSIQSAAYPSKEITLIISIDFWKSSNPCYDIADDFLWEHGTKMVIKHDHNLGLKQHVLFCGDLSQEYETVILLEDDVVVSPYFYYYATEASQFYYDRAEVMGVGLFCHAFNGYSKLPFYPLKNGYDTYYGKWVITWGECFFRNQWKEFRNWYDLMNCQLNYRDSIPSRITNWSDSSWSKYMSYYMDETDKYFVSPYEAYSTNFSDKGEHYRDSTSIWQTSMQYGKRSFLFADVNTAVRYNFFFENMDERRFAEILGIKEGKLLVDLYGQCKGVEKYDYCLSTRILDYKVINSFGIEMRPIEQNVFQNIEGDSIFLYDIRIPERRLRRRRLKQIYELYKYYYPLLQYYETLAFLFCETIKKIKEKF